MMTSEKLLCELAAITKATETSDGLRVSTHCLYPSNGVVTVLVRGGSNEFVITDDGGAIQEISGSGRLPAGADKTLQRLVKPQGLRVKNGVIYSPRVSAAGVASAVLLVANASKEVADWALSNIKLKVKRSFRRDLAALLGRHFHDNLKHDLLILGASNKQHRFPYVIYLARSKRLLVDPAVKEASSINACVVANMDVKMSENPDIVQLIVYDDSEEWDSAQIKLLSLGAPTVPFNRAESEIIRLAA
jgi:hypothetical protein